MSGFYPHPIIAREGWPFIIGGLAISILVALLAGWWSLPFWLFTLFALQFFRDPSRQIPQEADAVLSPVDGRVVAVEHTNDPYRNVKSLRISIFMNIFNVHSQRSPIDGTVTAVQYTPGKFLNAALDKASAENERNAVLATTRSGHEVSFVQVAGLAARRILCYTQVGDTLRRGERYGFIRFGSRVDVYLPIDAQVQVAIGDKVSGTSTVLAHLPTLVMSEAVSVANQPEKSGNSAVIETDKLDSSAVIETNQLVASAVVTETTEESVSKTAPPSRKNTRKKLKSANEQGFVLAIVLVTTLVSTIVILNATRTYYGEQRSSTNYADHKYALSLANAALQEGELYVRSKDFENKTFTENCRDGLCSPAGSRAFTNGTMTVRAGPRQRDLLQECQGGSCVIDTSGRKLRGNNSSNGGARYVIEYLGSDEQGSNIPSGGFPHSYRITAKGYGRNGNIQAVVQSYVVTRAPNRCDKNIKWPQEPQPPLFMNETNTIKCEVVSTGRDPNNGRVIDRYVCVDNRSRRLDNRRIPTQDFWQHEPKFTQLMGKWVHNKSSRETGFIPQDQIVTFCFDGSSRGVQNITCDEVRARTEEDRRIYYRQLEIWTKKVNELKRNNPGCQVPPSQTIDCRLPSQPNLTPENARLRRNMCLFPPRPATPPPAQPPQRPRPPRPECGSAIDVSVHGTDGQRCFQGGGGSPSIQHLDTLG